MPSQVTKYKIVTSSPSDIVEELNAVSEIIEYWNINNSDDYEAMLERVSWKTHATSEIGDRPQAIINKQLELKDCDILIAIFWTRLGTPTGKAESGTIEEIEEFRKASKPVSIYFSSIPVSPKNIDIEQYKRLSEIIEKYKNEGLVIDYNSIEQFRSKLQMDISRKIKLIRKAIIEVPKKENIRRDNPKVYPQPSIGAVKSVVKSVTKADLNRYRAGAVKSVVKTIPSAFSSGGGGGSGKGVPPITPAIINPRVYDEKILPAIGSVQLPSYKWDAQNFEGFWYDIQTGITSETLEIGGQDGNILTETIDHNKRVIPENTLSYRTIKQAKTLKVVENNHNSTELLLAFPSGKYDLLGWQAQPYIAVKGNAKKLAMLIIEQGNSTSEKKSLIVGETWDIGDGWTLTAQSIDARAFPRQVWLVLSKDGVKKDDKVIGQGSVYTYVEKSFAGESDVPLFVTYVDSVFAGATSDMVQLRYTWAIGTSVTEIQIGDIFGNMEVTSATNNFIELKNKVKSVDLRQDGTVDIIGELKFRVADDPNFLRFHPVVLRDQ
jgi:S-layer protein (TIGR01567 family)